MKLSMTKNNIIMSLVIATGGLVVVGNGCSRILSNSSSSTAPDDSSLSDGTSDPHATPGDIHVIIGAPTLATVYAKQALSNFETQLGVAASTRTIGTYETKRGTISQKGDVITFTAPMAMAVTAIVADVCDDLINQQASLRPDQKFFRDFNLTAAGKPTRSAMEYSIRALSLASWDRQPDDIEMNTLIDLLEDSVTATEVNGQRKAALILCTTMNSTTDSVIR